MVRLHLVLYRTITEKIPSSCGRVVTSEPHLHATTVFESENGGAFTTGDGELNSESHLRTLITDISLQGLRMSTSQPSQHGKVRGKVPGVERIEDGHEIRKQSDLVDVRTETLEQKTR